MRTTWILGCLGVTAAIVAVTLLVRSTPQVVQPAGAPPAAEGDAGETAVVTEEMALETSAPASVPTMPQEFRPVQARSGAAGAPASAASPSSMQAKELIGSIVDSASSGAPPSPAAIKQTIEALKAQGEAAVPAIREFLDQALEFGFGDAAQQRQIGYPSLRTALFDTLAQIGGDEARQVLMGSLGQTADPREIGLLAGHLERLAPGEYRDQIVASARETLELARTGQIQPEDVGPLFDVLRTHGGAEVIPDLQQAATKWGHYATMALAGSPEGIALVLEQASDTSARKPASYLFSFEVLAQSAGLYPEAGAGLVDLAQQGRIPDQAWALIANGLRSVEAYGFGKPEPARAVVQNPITGWRTGKVSGSGQYYYSPPLTANQVELIQQRLALTDSLLAATSSPAAIQALGPVRSLLGGGGTTP